MGDLAECEHDAKRCKTSKPSSHVESNISTSSDAMADLDRSSREAPCLLVAVRDPDDEEDDSKRADEDEAGLDEDDTLPDVDNGGNDDGFDGRVVDDSDDSEVVVVEDDDVGETELEGA